MEAIVLTKENFDEVIKNNPIVLVDFWAAWCGPCRMLSPIIDEIAEEMDDIVVGKVNVDNEGELAQRYGVMSIPTIVVFENGEVKTTSVGVKPKDVIISML